MLKVQGKPLEVKNLNSYFHEFVNKKLYSENKNYTHYLELKVEEENPDDAKYCEVVVKAFNNFLEEIGKIYGVPKLIKMDLVSINGTPRYAYILYFNSYFSGDFTCEVDGYSFSLRQTNL